MADATCPICAEPFVPHRDRQRYCSIRCRNRRPRTRRTPRPPTGRRQPRTCPVCERIYTPTCGDQKYCSRRCGGTAHRASGELRRRWPASRIYVRPCGWCGKVFVARRSGTGTCSLICSRRRNWQESTTKRLKPRRRCVGCDVEIPARSKRCTFCARRMRRINGKHRRRARKYGVPYQPINERAVFKRDRWRCKLCGKPVAKTKQVPHPQAPTIDCRVPLSEPGSPGYVLSNVQLAHFECNWRKNNGGKAEQLQLIG